METFLYNTTLEKVCKIKRILNVKSVVMNLKHIFLKKGNIVLINVDLKHYIGKHQVKREQENLLFVNSVRKIFILLSGRLRKIKVNSVQENVMGIINQYYLKGKEIQSILMEELRNIQKLFIYHQNGEILGKKFIREIIINAKIKGVIQKVKDCMHTIKYLLENVKIHLIRRISLLYVMLVIVKHKGGEYGFV